MCAVDRTFSIINAARAHTHWWARTHAHSAFSAEVISFRFDGWDDDGPLNGSESGAVNHQAGGRLLAGSDNGGHEQSERQRLSCSVFRVCEFGDHGPRSDCVCVCVCVCARACVYVFVSALVGSHIIITM